VVSKPCPVVHKLPGNAYARRLPQMAADAGASGNMLRVVFFGMDLRILDELRHCPAQLVGAHLPPAPYHTLPKLPAFLKYIARHVVRRRFKTVSIYLPLARYLASHQIPALPGNNVRTARYKATLRRLAPDLGVVANFGQILDAELIAILPQGLINFHPSVLPRYRGPTPLGHILLNRETIGGATWHRVAPDIDSGEILAQKKFPIDECDTVADLDRKSVDAGIDMLRPLLDRIARNRTNPVQQDEAKATYHTKLTKTQKLQLAAMGKLD
jgi:folate-dependent phosphoribosylglycinamide formyltransferase PurN